MQTPRSEGGGGSWGSGLLGLREEETPGSSGFLGLREEEGAGGTGSPGSEGGGAGGPDPWFLRSHYPEDTPRAFWLPFVSSSILMAYTLALANSYGRLISELKRQIETVSQTGLVGRGPGYRKK